MSVYEIVDEALDEAFAENSDVDNRAVDMVRGIASQVDQVAGPTSESDAAVVASILFSLGGAVSGILQRQRSDEDSD